MLSSNAVVCHSLIWGSEERIANCSFLSSLLQEVARVAERNSITNTVLESLFSIKTSSLRSLLGKDSLKGMFLIDINALVEHHVNKLKLK